MERLPPVAATVHEVKQWIYLVLTQRKFAHWVDHSPQLVKCTLTACSANGTTLRSMIRDASWKKVYPKTTTNVDGERVKYTKQHRKHVAASLSSVIIPLLVVEVNEILLRR